KVRLIDLDGGVQALRLEREAHLLQAERRLAAAQLDAERKPADLLRAAVDDASPRGLARAPGRELGLRTARREAPQAAPAEADEEEGQEEAPAPPPMGNVAIGVAHGRPPVRLRRAKPPVRRWPCRVPMPPQ